MGGPRYSIGQLSAISGRIRRTLDYYTRLGLLSCERSEGGHRIYGPDAVERLRQIVAFQSARLSLDEIRERLARRGDGAAEQVAAIESDLARLAGEAARLAETAGPDERRRLREHASRSAAHALALAQALMLLIEGMPTL